MLPLSLFFERMEFWFPNNLFKVFDCDGQDQIGCAFRLQYVTCLKEYLIKSLFVSHCLFYQTCLQRCHGSLGHLTFGTLINCFCFTSLRTTGPSHCPAILLPGILIILVSLFVTLYLAFLVPQNRIFGSAWCLSGGVSSCIEAWANGLCTGERPSGCCSRVVCYRGLTNHRRAELPRARNY